MPRTILIVEDTDLCRDSLEVALMGLAQSAAAGLRVHSVETVEQALASLDQEEVCAVITDLNLDLTKDGRDRDGFELIALLRSTPRYRLLPVIVTSGDTSPATAARLRQLGVSDYFPKPYSPSAVRNRLEQMIRSNGTEPQ